ncbi:MAG: hypothetical protein M1826_005071 [Phylliscum demangeonii]|nr:MAG: hypothetical protein M1826_005071 [Phylliscum demangeonii]
MDLAKTLIRSVARAFYETNHVLVVDALLIHSALRDDDLAHLLGMQVKELRKLCAKLDEHRLLAVHSRQETREGMQRPISRTWYYIDFRQTLDAIKYRIYRVTKEVEALIRPTEEKKDYHCPRCRSRWTQMEVLDNPGIDGFDCHKCGTTLERDEDGAGADGGGHEMQSKLMKQLEPLLILLPRIDAVVIPDTSFEQALGSAVPVPRNQTTHPSAASTAADILKASGGIPTAVKGMAPTAVQRIEVDLTSSAEKTAAEQAAEAERKARIAEQNALPVWHTNSTVTGDQTALASSKEEQARRERDTDRRGRGADRAEDEKTSIVQGNGVPGAAGEGQINDEVAEYYAQLARDQQKIKEEEEAAERRSSSSGGEDDDDGADEFEDVPAPVTTSAAKAPTAEAPTTAAATTNGAVSMARLPSHGSESSSSASTAPGTALSTPPASAIATASSPRVGNGKRAAVDDDDDDDPRAVKRAKLATPPAATTTTTTTTATISAPVAPEIAANGAINEGHDLADEDDVEFEDV